MHNFTPISALLGGALIGLAAAIMLILHGRIAGVSGIVGSLLKPTDGERGWRLAFIAGLIAGPALLHIFNGEWREITIDAEMRMLIAGGLLVGFGTSLGSGCTSGHGVCGIARLSARSLVATAVFMFAGAATVYLIRHGLS